LTIDQIITRHKQRSGFRLADYAEVALPIYTLNVQALTLAHRRLPPIQEFVLRCLALNIPSIGEMTAFLGLEEEVIKSALVTLAQTESIALTAPHGKQSWSLTPKGRITLETAELVLPEERTFPLHFDIITRKPVLFRFQKPLKHREAMEEGLKEIDAGPRKHPQLAEISPHVIERILKATPGLTDQRRDVLAIRSLTNIKPYYIRAIALVFVSTEGSDVQVAFLVDGKASQEHELAFARTAEFQVVAKALTVHPDEQKEVDAAASVAADLEPINKVDANLRHSTERVESDIAEATQALESAESNADRDALRERLRAAEDELQRLRDEAKKVHIRNLYVMDHPPLLENALTNSKTRMMIISPWIKRMVVNDVFVRKLEQLLRNGVQVYIGYGISEQPTENPHPPDEAAVKDLQRLATRYSNFIFMRLGNTHAKVLIKDSEFAAITSFNWLSFKGDPNKAFRDEQGTVMQVPDLVEQKFSELISRFQPSNTP
jgi:hypothetical protein